MEAVRAIAGNADITAAVMPKMEPIFPAPSIRAATTPTPSSPAEHPESLPGVGMKIDTEQLKELLEKMNAVFASYNTKLSFGMENNISWVRIINIENNEIIKQIPPEEIVQMLLRLKEIAGVLINEEK